METLANDAAEASVASAEDPNTTICPSCNGTIRIGSYPFCPHGMTGRGDAQRIDPVVLHYNPTTHEYRYPGHASARMPDGFVKQECRTFAEIDSATRKMNAIERRKVDRQVCLEQARIEHIERQNRGDLRMAMQGMPPLMRDLAQLAIDRNNARRPKHFDANLYSDARENTASSRGGKR